MGIVNSSPKIKYTQPCGYSYNAVQINMDTPTVNAPGNSYYYNYPQADNQIYYQPLPNNPTSLGENVVVRTPSVFEDYENYCELDSTGKEIASIKYSKDGNAIVQTIKTTSPDGTTLEKTLKNSNGYKTLNVEIKDKDGNILLSKNKSHKKIDDDRAQTIVNGDTYNVSGLSGDVLTVEHNGEIIQLDLNKMLNPDVKSVQQNISPENSPVRDTKITEEEKEKLFNRIKSLNGDDLYRLSKSVDTLQYLDEKSIESFYSDKWKTLLLSPKDWDGSHMVAKHELGHAINHSGINRGSDYLLSDSESFINIRAYEKQNFEQTPSKSAMDKFFKSKFLYQNPDFEWLDSNHDPDRVEATLRDETFAECYNNLNTMDMIHYDDEVLPMRTLSVFKYMPRTMAETERLSQI